DRTSGRREGVGSAEGDLSGGELGAAALSAAGQLRDAGLELLLAARFELSRALAADPELASEIGQGATFFVVGEEALLDHEPFPRVEAAHRLTHQELRASVAAALLELVVLEELVGGQLISDRERRVREGLRVEGHVARVEAPQHAFEALFGDPG